VPGAGAAAGGPGAANEGAGLGGLMMSGEALLLLAGMSSGGPSSYLAVADQQARDVTGFF